MGIDLIASCLAIPRGRRPDWDEAARWIAELRPEVLLGAGELFPIESWLEEGADPDGEEMTQGHALLTAARQALTLAACKVRAALESPAEAQLVVMDLPDHRVFAACSLDPMVEDRDLNHSFVLLGESGVARAAGFDHWTRFAEDSIDGRAADWMAPEEKAAPPGEILPIVASEVEPAALGPDSIAWVAIHKPFWLGGEEYIARNGLPDWLDEDLELISEYFSDGYARMVSTERVGDMDLLVAADCDAWGEEAVQALEALGEECVLDAIGAYAWSGRSVADQPADVNSSDPGNQVRPTR